MISAAQQPVIQVQGLNKSFGSKSVLHDFSLTLNKGENIAVLGKSGSGKSVLIKCMIGLIKPDGGMLKIFGESIPDLEHDDLDKIRARVGFLFQSNALYDSMSVRENLEFPLRRHWIKISKQEVNNLVMEALENVGLAETVDMMPAELSGGMRKRIALARTLIMKPEIILYDEPTTGLDPITSREIGNLMNEINQKYQTSSIIISHDLSCIRLTADKVATLIDGRCYMMGTYNELQKSDDGKIKPFFD